MSNNKDVDSGLSAPVDDNEGGAQPFVSEGDEAAIETQPQNSSIQDHESQPEVNSTQDHESQPDDREEIDDDHTGTGVESADGKELTESPKSEQEGENAAEMEPAQSMDGEGEVAPEAKAVPVLIKPKDPEEVKRDILALYQQGHIRDFKYPPWEQPDFGMLARVDRFGFIHADALPPMTKEERNSHDKLRSRETKWAKMIAQWGKFFGDGKKISPKLRDRTYKGIPDSWRGQAWARFLQIETVMQQGVYEELKGRLLESPDLYQIDIDINRTFRDHVAFRDRYCIKQQELFYVLAAYSLYNKEVGYCQGMSGIVAQLLLYMGEEQAFWALHVLFTSPKHGMNDLFVAGFPKLLQRWELHDALLKKKSKRLARHLEKEGVITSSYSSKWFMQCFQDKLPFYTVLRLWDCFMLDGYAVVSAAALAVMLTYEDKLLSMDFDGILTLLSANLENEKIDTDQLLKMTRKLMKIKEL